MNNNRNPYDNSNVNEGGQNSYSYPTSQKPLDDQQINPSYAVAPDGQSSMPENYGIQQTANQYRGYEPGRQSGLLALLIGIAGLILSIICTCISWVHPTVALILSLASLGCNIAAVVMGVVSGNTDANSGIQRNGFSVAAIVCGIIGIVFAVIALGCSGCMSYVLCHVNFH